MLDAVAATRRPAVIGVADHSGWANLVTVSVAGSGRPVVADRRRVQVLEDDLPRQPYHAAVGLDEREAERLVEAVTEAASAGSARTLDAVLSELGGEYEILALAVRSGVDRALPDTVAAIVANHSAIHAAEGELYRDGWADAAAGRGLEVALYPRNDAVGGAARLLETTADRLTGVLAALGRELGPPWRKEHREATAAALGELARHTPVTFGSGMAE